MKLPKTKDEFTLKELQLFAIEKGIKNADIFKTKDQLVSAIELIPEPNQVPATLSPTISPAEEKIVSKRWENKAEKMRLLLEKQPKVRILVPLEGKERQGVIELVHNPKTNRDEQHIISGSIQPVTLNGYAYYVPKGTYVEVPQQIAEVIQDKFKQTSEAGENIRIDRIDPETNRPVADQLI